LVNGLPGSGKSTLARRYAQDHPLTLVLDVDVVRGLLGRWLDEPAQAGLVARELALAMASTHLLGDRDVVVPQFFGRLDFVRALEEVADEVGVRFLEVALIVDVAEAGRRFAYRSAHPRRREDRDAAELLDRQGGLGELPRLQAQLSSVVAARPHTVLLSAEGDLEDTYGELLAALEPSSSRSP
jgi:predicted kinase